MCVCIYIYIHTMDLKTKQFYFENCRSYPDKTGYFICNIKFNSWSFSHVSEKIKIQVIWTSWYLNNRSAKNIFILKTVRGVIQINGVPYLQDYDIKWFSSTAGVFRINFKKNPWKCTYLIYVKVRNNKIYTLLQDILV